MKQDKCLDFFVRAGGRLKELKFNLDYIHPILLFGEGIATNLIIS